MTTELYLIRHGESHANVKPFIAGPKSDTGLTDRGRHQADLLEHRLRAEKLEATHLYSSTILRARETAEYVSRALQLPIIDDDELHEFRPGEADGLSVEEWLERYPGLEGGPWRNPFAPMAPGGESWATFLIRAGAALQGLVDAHPEETVVAVTHGGVLEASFYLAFGLGPSSRHTSFAPLNTSITRWRYTPGDDSATWTLVTFNDAGHLAGETGMSEQAVPTPAEED